MGTVRKDTVHWQRFHSNNFFLSVALCHDRSNAFQSTNHLPRPPVRALPPFILYTRFKRCLDLGCGTGLSGQAVSALCDRIVGVDLSPAMVRRATEKQVYRRLLVGDITETVTSLARRRATSGIEWDAPDPPQYREEGGDRQSGEAAVGLGRVWDGGGVGVGPSSAGAAAGANSGRGGGDLVLSCDVFGYIGDLRPCFKAVRGLLAGDDGRGDECEGGGGGGDGGAYFAFSAEAPSRRGVARASPTGKGSNQAEGERRPGYELQGTGR